ncbi:Cyd operon protein YbgE [compost metagenome]
MPDLNGWTQHGACRVVSLALAAPMGLLLLIHPGSMVGPDGRYSHGVLMLVMLAICTGFAHGVAFSVTSHCARWLTYPLLSWFLLVGGYLMLLQVQ